MTQRRRRARSATVVTALALAALATGCGTEELSADTKCSDYLERDQSERHDAAVRISSEIGSSSPGNPMWGLSLDAACGANRDMTLGEYFSQGN